MITCGYRNGSSILPLQVNKKRKTIIKIFKDISFSIDIQTNLKEVNFLDVKVNLQNDTRNLSSIQET